MTEGKKMTAVAAARAAALQGKTPRERGEEKAQAALDWIYRWGWASPGTADFIGGAARRGLASRLVKRGLLAKTRTEAGGGVQGVPVWILTLTRLGLEEVERQRETLLPYELDPYRIRQDQIRHYELAQSLTARKLAAGEISGFRTEKELAQRSAEGVKQPDILWTLNGDKRWAVEVELSAKWGRDFDDFILKCLRGLHKSGEKSARFDGIFLVTDSPAIVARYAAAFKPDAIYNTWEKDAQRRWKVVDSYGVPNWIEGKFICQIVN